MPGTDLRDAQAIVVGELPDLVHLVELPALGPGAQLAGRAAAVVTGLGFDLQPAGWRLTDAPGVDQRRAGSLLAQQLDVLEELTQAYAGTLKTQVAGPWTLAATVERPRGDRILADHGARRELAQSLAAGIADHVADIRRRVPGVDIVVQVDEPSLPAVLAARVPTASGFGRHRSVDEAAASAALEWVTVAISDAGATPVLHCCAAQPPIALARGAGFDSVAVDLEQLTRADVDACAAAVDAGGGIWLGLVSATEPATAPDVAPDAHPVGERLLGERVLRFVDTMGLDLEAVEGRIVVTPTCGLAGATTTWARTAVELCSAVARGIGERPAERR